MSSQTELQLSNTISEQQLKITQYETKLKDLIHAYKGILKEKQALEASLNAIRESSAPCSDGKSEDIKSHDNDNLRSQILTLTSSLATLTDEKNRLIESFKSDKKRVKEENDATLDSLNSLLNQKDAEIQSLQQKLSEMSSQRRLEQTERERDESNHALMLRELQKLVSDERESKETLETQINELQSKYQCKQREFDQLKCNLEERCRLLTSELAVLKNTALENNSLSTDVKPTQNIEQKYVEFDKIEVSKAKFFDEQKRLMSETEAIRAALASEAEERVATLEARLTELSQIVARYEKRRSEDQEAIHRLRNRIANIDAEGPLYRSPTTSSNAKSSFSIEKTNVGDRSIDDTDVRSLIIHLERVVKIARQRKFSPSTSMSKSRKVNLKNTSPSSDMSAGVSFRRSTSDSIDSPFNIVLDQDVFSDSTSFLSLSAIDIEDVIVDHLFPTALLESPFEYYRSCLHSQGERHSSITESFLSSPRLNQHFTKSSQSEESSSTSGNNISSSSQLMLTGFARLHRNCVEKYDELKNEFERYKLRAQSILKSKSKDSENNRDIDALKTQILDLRSTLLTQRQDKDELEEQYDKLLKSTKLKHEQAMNQMRRELAEIQSNYDQKVNEMETELRRHRDRTVSLLTEKEKELDFYRRQHNHGSFVMMSASTTSEQSASSFTTPGNGDFDTVDNPSSIGHLPSRSTDDEGGKLGTKPLNCPPVVDSALSFASDGNVKVSSSTSSGGDNAQETNLLHLAQEQARREEEISHLRREKHLAESELRELRLSLATENESHREQLNMMTIEVERLKRAQNRDSANMEYLKNVVYKYMTSRDAPSRLRMLRAIGTILVFSEEELKAVDSHLNSYFH